ncbi:protein SMG8 [Scaptodrosophila lebanonensis]|uniref:Nonsense-mediated mRNA decay factor SMG8 n=1 Tax=Drosophila lebanonensis TaxID=7225 RepID=A0A6J2U5S3_DROLE|nr:protein SMG8 [Scaptodrosophila lebanonensis]
MWKEYYTWTYPDMPKEVTELLALKENEKLVIVGIIGRSKCHLANKMAAFGMEPEPGHEPKDGQIQCYYKPGTKTLLIHFETTSDDAVIGQLIETEEPQTPLDFDEFYEQMRSRFVRMFLLALHVCHILVYVETSFLFDIMLVNIFRLLKFVREQNLLEFLPSLFEISENISLLGEQTRLCTPRILFLFENYPRDGERTRESISSHEFQTEDNIYELLRHYNIVSNSSASSLLALPKNKQFVFYNTHEKLHPDTFLQAVDELHKAMYKVDIKEEDEDLEILELAPFEGFVKPLGDSYMTRNSEENVFKREHTAWCFLQRHVEDALTGCFDEGSFKQCLDSTSLKLPNWKEWHDLMAVFHKVLVLNAQNDNFNTSNEAYKSFLENFDDNLNYERKFWAHLCELGLKKGVCTYKQAAPNLYGSAEHKQLLAQACAAFEEDGRGPPAKAALAKLSDICLKHWQDGRQQCEHLSLRGHPCVLSKDVAHDKHSSGVMHISSCNCGRTQGRREDPYSLRQANYDYYEQMANTCNLCVKAKQYQFAIFKPSISDYRAAAFEAAFPLLSAAKVVRPEQSEGAELVQSDEPNSLPPFSQEAEGPTNQSLNNRCSQPLSPTFGSDLNMSVAGFGDSLKSEANEIEVLETQMGTRSGSFASTFTGSSSSDSSSDDGVENELVLQVKQRGASPTISTKETATNAEEKSCALGVLRQASTTEYLPGLVHTLTAGGLLPFFPSWSLACVGPSSVYSHNTGLQEHFQAGFLSGANFLLPWDVHVRLQRATSVSTTHHKHHHQQSLGGSKKMQRYRKHGDRLMLKIFIGFEYECSRGHRFIMCSPDRILRGGADIERDTSTKVVHSNMPLYYPCPCRGQSNYLAQLMRVHVVTPKAPVNVILDPKVRVNNKYTFTLGVEPPPRLSQSAYWILRFPYVYQGDAFLINPPKELNTEDPLSHGCLLAGMFGVAEVEAEEHAE